MGFLADIRATELEKIHQEFLGSLRPKDGLVHVIMITLPRQTGVRKSEYNEFYNKEIDKILTRMQNEGYEILDMKFMSSLGSTKGVSETGVHTQIMYK